MTLQHRILQKASIIFLIVLFSVVVIAETVIAQIKPQENIVVARNDRLVLKPGNYGDIKVSRRGELVFRGGNYYVNSVTTEDNARLVFRDRTRIVIDKNLIVSPKVFIGPAKGENLTYRDIIFITHREINLAGKVRGTSLAGEFHDRARDFVITGTFEVRKKND